MQIALFLLLVAAVAVLFFSKRDTLSKESKIYMVLSLVAIFFMGWAFNAYSNKIAQQNREIILAYEQGKDIICQGYTVNQEDFIYVSGTLSFVSKDKKRELKGLVFDISKCKVK